MSLTHPLPLLDISLLQRGTEGVAARGHSTPVSVEIHAARRVHVTAVRFTLVHALTLTRRHLNPFGGTYRDAEPTTREVGSMTITTDITLREGESCRQTSQLLVPDDAVPTLSGKLATSAWCVRARVSSDGNEDVVSDHPLMVQARGDAGGVIGDDGTDASADDVAHDVDDDSEREVPGTGGRPSRRHLRVTGLSTRTLSAGTVLSGVAEVGGGRARAVVISIVMQEEVMHGTGQHLHPDPDRIPDRGALLVDETVVSGIRLPIVGRGDAPIPFTLAVPAIPAPTVSSPMLAVHWFLRAALDVPLHRDPDVILPLVAGTLARSRVS